MKYIYITLFAFMLFVNLFTEVFAYTKNDYVIRVDTTLPGVWGDTQFAVRTDQLIDNFYTYKFDVDCENDGIFDFKNQNFTVVCNYKDPGVYTVVVSGIYVAPGHWGNITDEGKILSIEQWGTNKWKHFISGYHEAVNLTTIPQNDVPILDNTFCVIPDKPKQGWHQCDLSSMFQNAEKFIGGEKMKEWDIEQVTYLKEMFQGAKVFNQDINVWNTKNVEDMSYMFDRAFLFNQPLNKWNTSNVIDMSGMFKNAISFNQDIGIWNTSKVKNTSYMFSGATAFNKYIGGWFTTDIVELNNTSEMFSGATSFNQPISKWNTSKVTNMSGMFKNATSFNQPIGSLNMKNVINMKEMLDNSGLSIHNYDLTLKQIATQIPLKSKILGAKGMKYCKSVSERDALITSGLNIIGDEKKCTANVRKVFSRTKDGLYGEGSVIDVEVLFDDSIVLKGGIPLLTLETGQKDTVATFVGGGNGNHSLLFSYVVSKGDMNPDLDYVSANSLSLNGATIWGNSTGYNVDVTLPLPGEIGSLGYNNNLIIDGDSILDNEDDNLINSNIFDDAILNTKSFIDFLSNIISKSSSLLPSLMPAFILSTFN